MGKKSLIKSTSKKKAGDTDPVVEKTPSAAAQSAKPAAVKKTAPQKAATKKKAVPKKAAAKKSTAKPAAKKKAPAAAKKTTAKKAATKKSTAKPAAKKKTTATKKKAAPKKAVTKTGAATPPVKKAAPPVEEKTTPAQEPTAPKVAEAPKAEVVKAEPTATAPLPQKETPPPPEKTAATAPVQAAATQDAVKDSSSAPKTPSAKAPQFTQPPERPAPAPEDEVEIAYEKPVIPVKPATAPMNPVVKYGVMGLAFLIFLVVGASATNSKRYYIKKRPLDIEISKGEFSPIGKKQLLKISGVAMPATTKAVYSRNDAYPMIFQYYLNHADALLENSEAPDYDAIKVLINKAQKYAVTPVLAKQATRRLAAIELHHLFYKANVIAEKGTIEAFDKGLGFLAQAKRLSLDEGQQAMVDHKIAEMKDARARIEVEKTVKEIMTTPPTEEKTAATH